MSPARRSASRKSRTSPGRSTSAATAPCRAPITASRRDGVLRVEVADAALLPAAYVRTRTEPDKAALLAALKAGEAIPGAALAQGEETLAVKVK